MFCPDPVAFTVFGRPIYWYGILIASAVLVGILLCYQEAKRKNIDPDTMLDFALAVVPAAIVCARLYYVIFEWQQYADDPIRALYIWEGGIAIYGAIIGGVIASVIFAKCKKLSFWKLMDIVTPALVLGQAVGRWGNFFNQEAFGYPVTNPALQWFPFSVYIERLAGSPEGPWHLATFFYESLACLVIFAVLLVYRRRSKQEGNVFLLYFVLYGVERAFVEGLRTDSLWFLGLRVSQVLSVILVLVCGTVLVLRWRRRVNDAGEVDPKLVLMRHSGLEEQDGQAAAQQTAAAGQPEAAAPQDAPQPEDPASKPEDAAQEPEKKTGSPAGQAKEGE